MMTKKFDVIIVGSGPAGVSSAFPLLNAGLNVLMVDGGRSPTLSPPGGAFVENRLTDRNQMDWMVGRDFHALREMAAASPKLRVPTHSYVFENFSSQNQIDIRTGVLLGSMASGGLSNAWGCGVAKFSAKELHDYPFPAQDLNESYAVIARRMGVSGARGDDLSEYFGLDEVSQPPVAIDRLQQQMLNSYGFRRERLLAKGFRLGRSRVAVLTQDLESRRACDLSGNCLWGCERKALYSALDDLAQLKLHPGFHYRPGFTVEQIQGDETSRTILGRDALGGDEIQTKTVILAAGTLASTRLVLKALNVSHEISMQSSPTAAFMLWLPRFLGARRERGFGLGQLSFTLEISNLITGFGSLFNTTGIPVSEFMRYMPLRKRYGVDVVSALLSSCVVGNMFLPGWLTNSTVSLSREGRLRVDAGYKDDVQSVMPQAERLLRSAFLRLGAVLLPKSFTVGVAGSDIHYGCTLPMRHQPNVAESGPDGQLQGLPGVYVVDGAVLPSLPEKSHTMTIMANADRIGRILSKRLSQGVRVSG